MNISSTLFFYHPFFQRVQLIPSKPEFKSYNNNSGLCQVCFRVTVKYCFFVTFCFKINFSPLVSTHCKSVSIIEHFAKLCHILNSKDGSLLLCACILVLISYIWEEHKAIVQVHLSCDGNFTCQATVVFYSLFFFSFSYFYLQFFLE